MGSDKGHNVTFANKQQTIANAVGRPYSLNALAVTLQIQIALSKAIIKH